MTTIKITSENRNIEAIVNQFKATVRDMPGTVFKFAEIRHNISSISNDPKEDNFYPLRMYTNKDVLFMISEVRCGYRGASTDAMIECIKSAGFELSRATIERIYNEPNLHTIIWSDKIKQY